MPIATSKLTGQGQISVPTEVRQRLGVGPGSTIEWDQDGDKIVVRRASRFTSEDIHRALFATTPTPRSLQELKAGVARQVKRRHARH